MLEYKRDEDGDYDVFRNGARVASIVKGAYLRTGGKWIVNSAAFGMVNAGFPTLGECKKALNQAATAKLEDAVNQLDRFLNG